MGREVLARLAARARKSLPEFASVTAAELEAFIAARVPLDKVDDDVRAEDLLLACACAKGVLAAHDALHELCEEDIDLAYARIRPPITLQQTRQLVWNRLLHVPEGGAARIALYKGDTDLVVYVRSVTNRHLLSIASQPKTPFTSIEEAILETRNGPADPDVERVKRNYLAGLRLVLTQILASLDTRERALLRDAIVERHDLASLSLMYGYTPSNVAERINNACEKLEYRIRNRLAERMRISDKDHTTLVRFFRTQLDAALVRAVQA